VVLVIGVFNIFIIPLSIVTSYFFPFTWAKYFSPPVDVYFTVTVISPIFPEFASSNPIFRLVVSNFTVSIASVPPTFSFVIGALSGYLVL